MLQIVLAILGLGGTLFGTWLGSWLIRANQERQWWRDRSLEAYADVMRISDSVVNEAHRLYLELVDDRTTQLRQFPKRHQNYIMLPTERRYSPQLK